MRAAALVAAAALLGALLAACGGGHGGDGHGPGAVPAARAGAHVAPVQVVPGFSLSGGAGAGSGASSRAVALPSPAWVASFDARGPVVVRAGSTAFLRMAGGSGWRHVEATYQSLSVDGRTVSGGHPGRAWALGFSGSGAVRALIVSAASDRGALLLHRVAELHARVPLGSFPEGADLTGRIHYGNTYWTSGFWPGALWGAAALQPSGGMFAQWALAATVAHFGQERTPTHDLGFIYGESSLAAWKALCAPPASRPPAAQCGRLRRSVLSAAKELVALERTNARAGTIPTNPTSGNTIVDSMMNLAILPWASGATGDASYTRVASRHAHVVASVLVRRDGSTAQSVNFDRATGRVLYVSTHQGLSDHSTWSRGQGWAVYGFSAAALDLHDRGLLRVALRTAGYVARHLPPGGIPLWDYDAGAGPVDVSAGVITATGLMHLAQACRALGAGACANPSRWDALGRRMLAAALTRASGSPPLGFLRDQVLNERGHGCWCNGGELSFGLTYALEGLKLGSHR